VPGTNVEQRNGGFNLVSAFAEENLLMGQLSSAVNHGQAGSRRYRDWYS
jgi:hypothetical protein